METIALSKKIPKSKEVTISLPQFDTGQEIEILVVINPLPKHRKSEPFDMVKWAQEWAFNFGNEIKSSDVESFTGRRF